MPAGETGEHVHGGEGPAPVAPFLPSPAAMRSALALLGVLDAKAEPVFDGLVALAASSVGAPMAEIAYVTRRGWVRKAATGGLPPDLTDDPTRTSGGGPQLVGRAAIVLSLIHI